MSLIQGLENHHGYPNGEHISCSIFNQNIINYLAALKDNDKINRTFAVALSNYPSNIDHQQLLFCHNANISIIDNKETLRREIIKFFPHRECWNGKYMLKYPNKTNGDCQRRCNNLDTLVNAVVDNFEKWKTGACVPYCLIQEILNNGKEYKTVMLDGKAMYMFAKDSAKHHAFSTEAEIFKFAEDALRILKTNRRGTIADGLVRVDVMERNDGKLIVNEFEGFEALFAKKGANEAAVHDCLRKFWFAKIKFALSFF